MIADMIHNKKLNSIVTELFIRVRKFISLVFITQSYFKVPKDVRLNTSHFFIAKIPNKRELQQIAINNSSDINTKDFANIYRKCTSESYSFLVNDATLTPNNLLRFRKTFLVYIIKIRSEMKNYKMILTEKQLKYHLYHQVKLINMNIFLVKIYYHLIYNK